MERRTSLVIGVLLGIAGVAPALYVQGVDAALDDGGRIVVVFDDAVPADPEGFARSLDGSLLYRHDVLLPFIAVQLDPGATVDEAVARASQAPGVRYAHEDAEYTLDAATDAQPVIVGDALRSRQWALSAIRAPEAWASLPLAHTPALVAVIDSGAQCTEPDLVAACVTPSEDLIGHGTHTAGIVAASRNTIGVSGTSDALVLPIKVFDDVLYPFGLDIVAGFKLAAAVLAATAAGSDVISMSLGGGDALLMRDAVRIAYGQGVVIVASAGNGNLIGQGMRYPALYPEVIAVAATQYDDGVASFSTRDPKVEVAAPGVGILSTYNVGARLWYDLLSGIDRACTGMFGNWQFAEEQQADAFKPSPFGGDDTPGIYCYMSGTSMAAPHVSGVAALLREKCPELPNTEIRTILGSTARDLGAPGRDVETGFGLIDAKAALDAASCEPLIGAA